MTGAGRRVWHVGVSDTPHRVSGVNQAVWALATAQAERGDRPTLLVTGTSREGSAIAVERGIALTQLDAAMHVPSPDVLHAHSVFIPAHARLCWQFSRRRLPYVVTPHGGVLPQDLAQSAARKVLYSTVVERRRFRRAAALTALLPPEEEHIRRYVGHACPPVHVIANALPPPPPPATVDRAVEDAVYLGRFDVQHKGLDRLAQWAEQLPDITFGIYGDGRRAALPPLPDNVNVHPPVHGEAKWRVLRSAAVYFQLSRWEAFGLSVVEAMQVGTTPVISRDMDIASVVAAAGGTVVAELSTEGLASVRAAVRNRSTRQAVRALIDAAGLVSPPLVAEQFDAVYDSV